MEKHYILEILQTLNELERKDFRAFLNAGVFTSQKQKEESFKLFDLLNNLKPDVSPNDSYKQSIYDKIYPNKAFINGKVDKLMVELNKSLKTFILIKHYLREENEFNTQIDLAKILLQKGLTERFEQLSSKTKKDLCEVKKKSKNHYLNKYIFENEQHEWESINNKQVGDLNIINTISSLDSFYLINRLELQNKLIIQKMLTKIESKLNFEISDLINIPNDIFYTEPMLAITYEVNKIISNNNPSTESLYDLLQYLRERETQIHTNELKKYYIYIKNICAILYTKDNKRSDLVTFSFKLQKEIVSRGYILHDKKIHPNSIFSAVNLALRLKEFDWAFDFIVSCENKIIGDNKSKDYYRLNLCRYYFETKKYEEAILNIPMGFKEIDYNNIARRIEIKTYYETNSNLLFYKIDAFKMYLTRIAQKIYPDNKKEHQINFVYFLMQIVQSIPGDKPRAQKIIKRILAKKLVVDRDWLLEKARELGNLSDDEYAEAIKNPPTKE